MKKGQKKRVWTKEQKLEIIGKHLNEHISEDYLTNSITKPLFNIELNKGLSNWWFLLSTFT